MTKPEMPTSYEASSIALRKSDIAKQLSRKLTPLDLTFHLHEDDVTLHVGEIQA